jgi:hypothetical protein
MGTDLDDHRTGAPGWSSVLLRLPYLALTSVFTLIRLLPLSDTDKDIEILALRLWVPKFGHPL